MRSNARAAEERLQPAGGKIDVQKFYEEQKYAQAQDKADGEIARHFRAAESARNTGEEHSLCEHETGGVDEKNLRE